MGNVKGPALAMGAAWLASALWAQEGQDWIPAAIALPDDMEITVDRAIGSSTRMFSFSTSEDAASLIESWRVALAEGGYVVEEPSEALDVPELEFSGEGIGNAKITVKADRTGDRNVVQFDASLTD